MVRLSHCIQVPPPSPEISSQMLSPSRALVRRAHAYCTPLMFLCRSSRVRPSTTADWTFELPVAFVGSIIPVQDTETDILPSVLLWSECRHLSVNPSPLHRQWPCGRSANRSRPGDRPHGVPRAAWSRALRLPFDLRFCPFTLDFGLLSSSVPSVLLLPRLFCEA